MSPLDCNQNFTGEVQLNSSSAEPLHCVARWANRMAQSRLPTVRFALWEMINARHEIVLI